MGGSGGRRGGFPVVMGRAGAEAVPVHGQSRQTGRTPYAGARRSTGRWVPIAPIETIAKVCFLGDVATRKHELLKPLVYRMFDDKYVNTIGAKVMKLDFHFEGAGPAVQQRCTLLIWDINGQRQYGRLWPVFFQGAQAAVVVCALDRPATVASVPGWVRAFREVVGDVQVTVLVDAGKDVDAPGLGPVRAVVGDGVTVCVTSVGTPERTREALEGVARGFMESYVERAGPAGDGESPGAAAPAKHKRRFGWPRSKE